MRAVEMGPGRRDECIDPPTEWRGLTQFFEGPHESFGEASEGILEDRTEDAVFAPEMMLDRTPGDARAARDFRGGRPLKPDVANTLDGGGQNSPSRLGRPLHLGSAGSASIGQAEQLRVTHAGSRYHICIAGTM